jgi:hypothetical protein
MSAWVRRLVTFACLAAAWLVVRPAAASAPMCDDRGASMLAPAPILDTPTSSVDVGDHDTGCEAWLGHGDAYHRSERPTRVFPSLRTDFIPYSVQPSVPPSCRALALRPGVTGFGPAGVRVLLERPPRL